MNWFITEYNLHSTEIVVMSQDSYIYNKQSDE